MRFKDIRNQCYQANLQLPELGLVLFTFGNASVVDRKQQVFAIKPSGVAYRDLTPEKIVIVDFEGTVVEGELRPSSDTKTHAVLYKHWSFVGGIVHTHSTYATGWAQTQLDIPILGTTHADHLTADIPCAPVMDDEMIEGDYEYQTGLQIINDFTRRALDPREVEMMLVANHAPFTWGPTVESAVYNSAVLEELAKMAYISKMIHPGVQRMKQSLINKHYQRKHGNSAYYGQET